MNFIELKTILLLIIIIDLFLNIKFYKTFGVCKLRIK
jgi:hypothetical protein